MNATDSEERINAGFMQLLEQLRGDSLPDPKKAEEANRIALEREQARMRAEYLHLGLDPPSPIALSITARRELGYSIPTQQAAE